MTGSFLRKSLMTRARISALVLVTLLSGCGGGSSASPAAAAPSTVVSGKLIACTDMPYEPFEFQQNGTEKGIDVDLVREIARDLGLTAEFRSVDFDDIFAALERRDCDLVASAVSITPERQRAHLFSSGYFEVSQSLVIRAADTSRLPDLAALNGERVGVQKGTTGADYAAQSAPRATLVPFDDAREMVDALRKGRIAGVVQDFPINSYEAKKSSAGSVPLSVVATFSDVSREQYGFAMRSGAEALRDAVDAALQRIRQDGRYDDILIDYLGSATAG